MPLRLLWAALFASCLLLGQASYSTHSGWSLSDTLQSGDNVVVADLLGGSGEDNGDEAALRAQIRIVRTLRGSLPPESTVNLAWRYHPMQTEGPAQSTKVPLVRVLCFLRAQSAGVFEPLQLGNGPDFESGHFLTVPSTPPSGSYFAAANAAPEVKIADELAWSIEDLLARYGPVLHPQSGQDRAARMERGRAVLKYRSTADILLTLGRANPASTKAIFQNFSSRPEPDLEMLGIAGRLEDGDPTALALLEQHRTRLLDTELAYELSSKLMSLDLSHAPESVHTLARIAFADQTFTGVESDLASQVGRSRRIEYVPYLMALMESPSFSLRDLALMQICFVVKGAPQWKPEMAEYCPNASPMADRAQEQKDLQYWKEWWTAQRPELAKTVALPAVAIPARYTAPPPTTGFREVEAPLWVRFNSILHQLTPSTAQHYHAGDGAMVQGTPPVPARRARLFDSVFSNDSDRELFYESTGTLIARLAELDTQARTAVNSARMAGKFPDRAALAKLEQERRALLDKGLEDLRLHLSPAGWQAFEKRLMQGAVGSFVQLRPSGQ